jgi:signal transduction histidine kinase/DNA-binding response OmpR family regulator
MILIVDDKPENIFSLKSILKLHNFLIDTADSGEEALKKILNNTYSLIIMDVQMPGMDGFEVAETIAGFNKSKDTPIIFLSAVNTDKRFITKGYTSGGIDYVTKPVDPDILIMKVKTFYKLSEQKRELTTIQDSLRKEIEIRKKAQDDSDIRMQELRQVLESLPEIAFTIKPDGEIEYANKRWYDYSPSLQTFPETHSDNELNSEHWKEVLKTGVEYTSEVKIKNITSQEYRYFLLKIIPVKQGETILKFIGTFSDIHQQKLTNEVLEQKVTERTSELSTKNQELETTNHELQQFAWVVSHDLKEPLRKIQAFCGIIRDKFLKGNEEAESYLERAISSSNRMSTLINDLLDFSRLSVSTLFKPTVLNATIDELLHDFDTIINEKHAVIKRGDLPVLEAVPTQMRQIFQNLISNALKFSKKEVTPVITISSERIHKKAIDSPPSPTGKYCRITVTDNGIGFDEKYLDRIFVIFQRLNNRTTYEGTGIGLAIAKKIVDKHNGLITATSKENVGTSFIIVLPIDQHNNHH